MTSESFPPSGIDENFLCRALADVSVPLIVRPQLKGTYSLGTTVGGPGPQPQGRGRKQER